MRQPACLLKVSACPSTCGLVSSRPLLCMRPTLHAFPSPHPLLPCLAAPPPLPQSSRWTKSWGWPFGMPRLRRFTSRTARHARRWRAGRHGSWHGRRSGAGCRRQEQPSRQAEAISAAAAFTCVSECKPVLRNLPNARGRVPPFNTYVCCPFSPGHPAQRLPVCSHART